jgi:hypothetical protein
MVDRERFGISHALESNGDPLQWASVKASIIENIAHSERSLLTPRGSRIERSGNQTDHDPEQDDPNPDDPDQVEPKPDRLETAMRAALTGLGIDRRVRKYIEDHPVTHEVASFPSNMRRAAAGFSPQDAVFSLQFAPSNGAIFFLSRDLLFAESSNPAEPQADNREQAEASDAAEQHKIDAAKSDVVASAADFVNGRKREEIGSVPVGTSYFNISDLKNPNVQPDKISASSKPSVRIDISASPFSRSGFASPVAAKPEVEAPKEVTESVAMFLDSTIMILNNRKLLELSAKGAPMPLALASSMLMVSSAMDDSKSAFDFGKNLGKAVATGLAAEIVSSAVAGALEGSAAGPIGAVIGGAVAGTVTAISITYGVDIVAATNRYATQQLLEQLRNLDYEIRKLYGVAEFYNP